MKKSIVTVVGKDSVGIIAKVCSYLAENGINILDVSQTAVDGDFRMTAVTDMSDCVKELGVVRTELHKLGLQIGVDIQCEGE